MAGERKREDLKRMTISKESTRNREKSRERRGNEQTIIIIWFQREGREEGEKEEN